MSLHNRIARMNYRNVDYKRYDAICELIPLDAGALFPSQIKCLMKLDKLSFPQLGIPNRTDMRLSDREPNESIILLLGYISIYCPINKLSYSNIDSILDCLRFVCEIMKIDCISRFTYLMTAEMFVW